MASKKQQKKKTFQAKSFSVLQRAWLAVKAQIDAIVYAGVFALLWLHPSLFSLTYGTLDPSFVYGVEKAALMRLSFGTDFIATYGPLGYAVNNFLPENAIRNMLWHLAAVVLVGFGVKLLLKLYATNITRIKTYVVALLVLWVLALARPEWLYLDIFLLYTFVYLRSIGRAQLLLGYGLAVGSAILMLVKFTGGAAATAAFITVIATTHYGKYGLTKFKAAIPVYATYLVTLFGLGALLGTYNIPAYLLASTRMSNGFNNALPSVAPRISIAAQYAAAAFVIYLIWVAYRLRSQAYNFIFLLPVFYIIWKYAIVRLDGHILVLIQFMPVLVVLFILYLKRYTLTDVIAPIVIVTTIILGSWAANIGLPSFQEILAAPHMNLRTHGVVHFFNIGGQKRNWNIQTAAGLSKGVLPASMREKIGNASVDVFPWEADLVLANNLKWHNRPSPFAFETYTPQFDAANASFYQNEGPEYIVWHSFSIDGVSGIDGRTHLWDEPATFKAILANYSYVEHNDKVILLKRKSHPEQVPNLSPSNTYQTIGTSSAIVPESNDLQCVNIAISDNIIEKAKTFTVRQRPFYINLLYDDGSNRILRFVRETANEGMVINQLPRSWDELAALFDKHQTTDKVKQFAVVAEPSTKVAFHPCLQGKD